MKKEIKEKIIEIIDTFIDNYSIQNTHFIKTPFMNVFIVPRQIDCAFVYMVLTYLKKRGFNKEDIIRYYNEIEKNWEQVDKYKFLRNL